MYILGKPEHGYVIDHINNIGLDNRRSNLRIVTRSINSHNRLTSKEHQGVTYDARYKRPWCARFGRKYLGSYATAAEAHEKYKQYVEHLLYPDRQPSPTILLTKRKRDLPKNIRVHKQHLELGHKKVYFASITYKGVLYASRCYETILEAVEALKTLTSHVASLKKHASNEHYMTPVTKNEQGIPYICMKNGEQCLVDEGLWHDLQQHKWSYDGRYVRGYVKGKLVRLHRYLMKATDTPDTVIDHINGNRLDNRLINLRVSTHAQNNHNRKPKALYRGVRKYKNSWISYVVKDGIKWQCCFDSEINAALAFNIKTKELYGAHAFENTIDRLLQETVLQEDKGHHIRIFHADMYNMIRPDKAKKFFELANFQANLFSKDPNTKVGCILLAPESLFVLSTGYNGLCKGLDETKPERWQRQTKHFHVVHAEQNCLANACRHGISLANSIAIVTLFPCTTCAKLLIQSGIKYLVTKEPDMKCPRWGEEFKYSLELLQESGIDIMYVETT